MTNIQIILLPYVTTSLRLAVFAGWRNPLEVSFHEEIKALRLGSGETLMTHVPSHHNYEVGEWIGIRAEVDHVVTFERGGSRSAPPAPGVAVR